VLNVNHDSKYDILSISFDDRVSSYSKDSYDGIEVFYDTGDNEIAGLLIYDFMKRYRDKTLFDVNLPVRLDFSMLAKSVKNQQHG
jgi:hypothetical protein